MSELARHDTRTGIQRVGRAIWSELAGRQSADFEFVAVAANARVGFSMLPLDFLDQGEIRGPVGKPVAVRRGDKFLGLDLDARWLPAHKSQVVAWRKAGATVHVVVYDLLPLQCPKWFNLRTRRHFKAWWKFLQIQADQLLCISVSVSQDVLRKLEPARRQIEVKTIALAGDLRNSKPSRGISRAVQEFLVQSPAFVLMVGTVEPRKAYDQALLAFEELWREKGGNSPALVIVGKPGWRTGAIQDRIRLHLELNKRLFWLTDASDEALDILYNKSLGVFLTSRGEGFGLPAIEAAVHGRRALVRDLTVFREQNLPNLTYFQDDDPVQLAQCLAQWLHLPPALHPTTLPTWSDAVDGLLVALGPWPTADGLPAGAVALETVS